MARVKKPRRTGSILLSRHRNAVRSDRVPLVSHTHIATTSALSSKVGRAVIRKHHSLQKRLSQALIRNDVGTARSVQAEIEENGGIEKYQHASVCGQSSQRGGDSSKVFIEWIEGTRRSLKLRSALAENKTGDPTGQRLRLLEVGALSPDNACSKSLMFEVKRIDLNSWHPAIKTQDFMERPLPKNDNEKFDIISLSLVLNYVSLPSARGEMLRRTTKFLHDGSFGQADSPLAEFFPSLFLVLPAPCITNSRYLNEERLTEIMNSLGYTLVRSKLSAKLCYQLWRLSGGWTRREGLKKKEEVNPGKTRNNFTILLE